jgi:hypothetical protein
VTWAVVVVVGALSAAGAASDPLVAIGGVAPAGLAATVVALRAPQPRAELRSVALAVTGIVVIAAVGGRLLVSLMKHDVLGIAGCLPLRARRARAAPRSGAPDRARRALGGVGPASGRQLRPDDRSHRLREVALRDPGALRHRAAPPARARAAARARAGVAIVAVASLAGLLRKDWSGSCARSTCSADSRATGMHRT